MDKDKHKLPILNITKGDVVLYILSFIVLLSFIIVMFFVISNSLEAITS